MAIPDTLLESELFGYEKGAFTGAAHRRIGKIEQAHGGTIFLDEIGDMPFSLQSKMLRLLQEKSIERLGGREMIPTNVRIIAATNRDLEKAIADGRFREDLYYRLKVVTIWLPPLSKRTEDIPLLAEYFLARFAAEGGIDNPGITDDAKAMLREYRWPGNVREISNVIHKALIFNRGTPLSSEDITQTITEKPPIAEIAGGTLDDVLRQLIQKELMTPSDKHLFDACIDRFASLLISEALNLTDGNRSRAAKLLGLSRRRFIPRSTSTRSGSKRRSRNSREHQGRPALFHGLPEACNAGSGIVLPERPDLFGPDARDDPCRAGALSLSISGKICLRVGNLRLAVIRAKGPWISQVDMAPTDSRADRPFRAALRRASSTAQGSMSTPTPCPTPSSIAVTARIPDPVPTSRTAASAMPAIRPSSVRAVSMPRTDRRVVGCWPVPKDAPWASRTTTSPAAGV